MAMKRYPSEMNELELSAPVHFLGLTEQDA